MPRLAIETVRSAPVRRLDPRRWALAGVGVACVGMGIAGVILPGVPTTIFLIAASWCFAKSCPVMERWLLSTPIFRPYARYLDPAATMPRRARVISLAMMWAAIGASGWVFASRGVLELAAAPLVLAGALGTVAIMRFRR